MDGAADGQCTFDVQVCVALSLDGCQVSWTVLNEGTGGATQPWTDYVYFSSDTIPGGDPGFTFVTHTSNLAATGSYSVVDHQFTIPSVPAGTYHLLLRTDALGNVYEGLGETDNDYPTPITMTVQ